MKNDCRGAGLVVCFLTLAGCPAEECTWGVDAVLKEFSDHEGPMKNCGSLGYFDAAKVEQALFCLQSPEHSAASVTVNYCVDCASTRTHVRTSAGRYLEIRMDDDSYGDGLREISVSACSGLEFNADNTSSLITCLDPEPVYACSEER